MSSEMFLHSHIVIHTQCVCVVFQAQRTGGGGVASCYIALAFYRCSVFMCMPTNE